METIAESVKRSTDTFMSHFRNTYSNPHPPVWITFEVLQMGQLSMLYNNLATSPDKKAVAHYFGVTETVFISWLHSLVYVRNICAHHARLWNKELRVPVKLPKTPMRQWPGVPVHAKAVWKVYLALAVIVYLLNIINPAHHFKQKLKDILAKYPVMSLSAMGFPQGWENDPFWV